MKKITAYLLILVLSTQCLLQLGIISWYQTHKEEIIDLFCVNKDKSQLQCDGKCYLNAQLEKIDVNQKSNHDNPEKAESKISLFLVSENFQINLRPYHINHIAHPKNPFSEKQVLEVFKPPKSSI